MNTWLIVGLISALVLFGGLVFVGATFDSPVDTISSTGYSTCGNQCTLQDNCGSSTCGAIKGEACNCGRR